MISSPPSENMHDQCPRIPLDTSFTLPKTNSSHLKMDGWETTFILGPGLFSGAMNH